MSRPDGDKATAQEIADDSDDEEAVIIYASRLKLVVLTVPAFLIVTLGMQGIYTTGNIGIGHGGLILLGAGMGAVLLHWAFDSRPMLIIDRDGITCRRPALGLIPWRAVAGLGMGRMLFAKNSLLVGVDESELDEESLTRLKRQSGLSLWLNPSTARFRSAMKDARTVQIPITFMAITANQLQQVLEEKIHTEE